MIRFNILNYGFLDMDEKVSLAFKSENPFFRFADVSLARSVEFSVPATIHNQTLLDFGDDASFPGVMLRNNYPCQMDYDGGQVMGTLSVLKFDSTAFRCVFYIGGSTWVDRLQNLRLADCITSFTKGILWSSNTTPVDADVADPSQECLIINYENGLAVQPPTWQLVPSINVKFFLLDIMANLGVSFYSSISSDYWLVSGSLRGGSTDTVVLTSSGANASSISSQTQGYFTMFDDVLKYSRNIFFGIYAGGSIPCKWFEATQNVKITIPTTFPNDVMMIGWTKEARQYKWFGGRGYNRVLGGLVGEPLAGRTIEVKKGERFCFVDENDVNYYEYGATNTYFPYTLTFTVERDEDLTIGEVWQLRENMPDMTVFEFLKSVALATGLELTVDPVNGVTLAEGSYGQTTDFVPLENVMSTNVVERVVESWGNNVRTVVVGFDSEDYVEQPLTVQYNVDNYQRTETAEHKSKFSEGNVGANGILIEDVEQSGGNYKFAAKKWTLARVDTTLSAPALHYLQRVELPMPPGYADIARNSTCITIKVAADEAMFFGLTPSTTFVWRGMAFVWTDAQWQGGVLSLTLQRVSQHEA